MLVRLFSRRVAGTTGEAVRGLPGKVPQNASEVSVFYATIAPSIVNSFIKLGY